MADKPKGYLSFRPIEASGLNKDEQYVWPSSDFEGFVKGEASEGALGAACVSRRALRRARSASVGQRPGPPAGRSPRAAAPRMDTAVARPDRRRRPAAPARPPAPAVELRGGSRNVKAATRRVAVQGSTIFWNEPLVL
jgi:hypothetical protein